MSGTENMDQKDSWVVAVESSLEAETIADNPHGALIHTVPKSLLSENTTVFYLPQVISFGPYHFKKNDPLNDDMELLKSEVARKMHNKIINKGGLNSTGLRSVMEKFKEKEDQQKIKESYAKEFKLSSEVCAWMIVRDACFVLEVLGRFREDEDAGTSVSASRYSSDRTLSRRRLHPLLTEVVKDMLKMENQLPFWAVEKIRLDIEGSNDDVWFESALKNLSPIEVAKVEKRTYNKESHILQLLHDYIVERQDTASSDPQSGSSWKTFILRTGREILCCPFKLKKQRCLNMLFNLLGYVIILLVLSPVFVMLFIWGIIFAIWYCIKNYISPKEEEIGKHVPTVEELKRVGVKFKKSEGDKRIGISDIKFKESDSTLYLPKFKVDNRSEVILRNLIALEICSQEVQKPITRYAILMNDLVNTSGDVGILRREDIITSKLGSDDEIAQLWNSMVTATEMPRYESIDSACSSINRYRKKWWKVLWAQFIMVHCSKPWLFLSLLAGLTLLMLTLVQVICLFESCQLK